MLERMLLAVDRSSHSRRAARVAAGLAGRFRSELLVVHALPAPLTASLYSRSELARAGVESEARGHALVTATVARLRREGVGAEGRLETSPGPIAARLLTAAREFDADLIVMGARGLSPWRGLLLGSVTRAVVQLAAQPVLVVRGPDRSAAAAWSPGRILLGVDRSTYVPGAVEITAGLASRTGASVRVVHVAEEGSPARGDALLESVARSLGADRVSDTRLHGPGPWGVAGRLGDEAARFGADLIVVGRRGRSRLSRLLLGSTAGRLLEIAPCPVLVVPRRRRGSARPGGEVA